MHLVARFTLCLILLIQPSICWVAGGCAEAHKSGKSHECCCGDACPAMAAHHGGIAAPCKCGADQNSQPAQPSKSLKELKLEVSIVVPVYSLPMVLPSAQLILKPQMKRSLHETRSINTILCIWLT